LILATNGTNVSILDSDFNKFSATTFGGNLQIRDQDGLNLDYVDLAAGSLNMETFAAGLLSNNSTLEASSGILDTLKSADAILNINDGDFGLNASKITTLNSLVLNVLNGDVNANSLVSYPQLTVPDLQITASGRIGGPASPIGINIAALGSTSFIDAQGGVGFYDFTALSGLRKNVVNSFYLYPLAPIPVIVPPAASLSPLFSGSTNPFVLSSTVYENNEDSLQVDCEINSQGLQVCRKIDKDDQKAKYDFQNVYLFGNKVAR
jgi:hypothetical protein